MSKYTREDIVRMVREASASSFECLGGGYGKDAWNVFYMGRKLEGVSPSAFRMPGRR